MPDSKMPDRYHAPAEAYQRLGPFPHCDQLVLHRPSTCDHCDLHPDWQALREVWEINFTGEDNPQKSPCPSAKYRPAYLVHQWQNNRPTNEKVEIQPPTAWEHLAKDDDETV